MKNTVQGSCYCKAMQFALHTDLEAAEFKPRCDEQHCSFCWKNDGTWISDPNGQLEIINDETVKTQISPSKMWHAHFCGECGTLCYGILEDGDKRLAVIRPRALNDFAVDFSQTVDTDFTSEDWDAMLERRRKTWTPVQ